MSKQIVKSLSMLTLGVGLALAVAVVSANGQVSSQRVTAQIPFDFIVGDQILPSGQYTVKAITSDGDGLRISSRDGKSSAIRLSNSVAETSKKRNARMVFHRYGQHYFLAEVWSGNSYGQKLMPCKRERNLKQELASNRSKSDSAQGTYQIVEVLALVR